MRDEIREVAQELMQTAKRLLAFADKLPESVKEDVKIENQPKDMTLNELRRLVAPYLKADQNAFRKALEHHGADNITKLKSSSYNSFLAELKGGTCNANTQH